MVIIKLSASLHWLMKTLIDRALNINMLIIRSSKANIAEYSTCIILLLQFIAIELLALILAIMDHSYELIMW